MRNVQKAETAFESIKTPVYSDATQRALLIGAAVCLVAGDNRFWMSISTWMDGAGAVLCGAAVLVAGLLLIGNLVRKKTPMRAEFLLPVFVYWLLIGTWARFGLDGSAVAIRAVVLALPIYAILCLDREDKTRLLYSVGMVFAVLTGLAAVFFLLRCLDAPIPFFTLESSNLLKVASGMYYEVSYLGGTLLNHYGSLVYCGVFDEAGCVGTFAALLFVAVNECRPLESLPYVRAMKVALIVEGALSFSLAFLLLVVAYLVYRLFKRGNTKTALAVLATLLVGVLLTTVDPQQLGQLGSLRNRLEAFFAGDGISNNRVNEQTDMIMRGFYSTSDALVSLFGYGQSSFNAIASASGVDGCSVVLYLYDYGYVGVALYYIVIIVLNRCSGRSVSGCWVPLLLFLVSTYQRPEVMSSLYLAILMLGYVPEAGRVTVAGKATRQMSLGPSQREKYIPMKRDGKSICR